MEKVSEDRLFEKLSRPSYEEILREWLNSPFDDITEEMKFFELRKWTFDELADEFQERKSKSRYDKI